MSKTILLCCFLVQGVFLGFSSAEEIDNATCFSCHGDPSSQPYIDPAKFESSIHGKNLCTSCHSDIKEIPHEVQNSNNQQSPLYWQNIPETCGKCHENIKQTYLRSVHGQAVKAGKREAPVCTDCHGEHSIDAVKLAVSKVSPAHIPETCGQCHRVERIITKYQLPAHVVETYMESFHGLAMQMGSLTAANCASCHGAHDILPSSDSRSSVYPGNLQQTCGKCHAGVSIQVARGQIHSGTQPGLEHRAVGFIRKFYLFLILLVTGGMLIHNLLDFRRKLRQHYQKIHQQPIIERMTLNERIQHGLLIVAFAALAYTGFALKFPQAWWASPFMGRFDWRSNGHRAAALLFVLLAAYHLWFMLLTQRGRQELRELCPRRMDFIQPFQMLAYYLGIRKERPLFTAKYSYIEKTEYWALVWGSVIMALTGVLLTWEGWTLRLFPKWFFDVVTAIHYYEAILACLAILIWHFYFTIFDPEVYPMKWSWISGKSTPSDKEHHD